MRSGAPGAILGLAIRGDAFGCPELRASPKCLTGAWGLSLAPPVGVEPTTLRSAIRGALPPELRGQGALAGDSLCLEYGPLREDKPSKSLVIWFGSSRLIRSGLAVSGVKGGASPGALRPQPVLAQGGPVRRLHAGRSRTASGGSVLRGSTRGDRHAHWPCAGQISPRLSPFQPGIPCPAACVPVVGREAICYASNTGWTAPINLDGGVILVHADRGRARRGHWKDLHRGPLAHHRRDPLDGVLLGGRAGEALRAAHESCYRAPHGPGRDSCSAGHRHLADGRLKTGGQGRYYMPESDN